MNVIDKRQTSLPCVGFGFSPTHFSGQMLLSVPHKRPKIWPSSFSTSSLQQVGCRSSGSGRTRVLKSRDVRRCHCLSTSVNTEQQPACDVSHFLVRMRNTSAFTLEIRYGSHSDGNMNELSKKSDLTKKSELSIKPCSLNVALDMWS